MSEPIEYTTAREQDRAEGYRAGIEAAARIEDRLAEYWGDRPGDSKSTLTYGDLAEGARSRAAVIRALADKPAPDAVTAQRLREFARGG